MKPKLRDLDAWLDYIASFMEVGQGAPFSDVTEVARQLKITSMPGHVITVAGTNGKGSVVAVIESMAKEMQLSIASFTSPHLVSFNERYRINGRPVSESLILEAFEKTNEIKGNIKLNYFQFIMLAGLWLLKRMTCDLYVLEVGLGGRTDPVSLVKNTISVITGVALDHCELLGNTLDEIAFQKAGVIQEKTKVVFGDRVCLEPIKEEARLKEAELFCLGTSFDFLENKNAWTWISEKKAFKPLDKSSLLLQNISIAFQAMSLLYPSQIEIDLLNRAIKGIKHPARGQLLPGKPQVLLDVAHNPQAMRRLKNQIELLNKNEQKVMIILGFSASKDIKSALEALKTSNAHWCVVSLNDQRSASTEAIKKTLVELGETRIMTFDSLEIAWKSVQSSTQLDDLIVVTGSFIVVGDFIRMLKRGSRGS
jgi:dihydrofolate synthase / folylpolyglutamate synthase